jgi:hypothetical protein
LADTTTALSGMLSSSISKSISWVVLAMIFTSFVMVL